LFLTNLGAEAKNSLDQRLPCSSPAAVPKQLWAVELRDLRLLRASPGARWSKPKEKFLIREETYRRWHPVYVEWFKYQEHLTITFKKLSK